MNRILQPLYCKGIFCANIDIPVMRARGNSSNQHPFNHPVRIAFHHAAVHKRAWIALVAVADDIFDLLLLRQHLRPFSSSGKASASPSPQGSLRHFVHDLQRRHVKQCFCHGAITAYRYVFFDGLRINPSTVLQGHPGLLLIERNIILLFISFALFVMVHEALNNLICHDALVNDLLTVFCLNLDI